jgi:hypothetical protein
MAVTGIVTIHIGRRMEGNFISAGVLYQARSKKREQAGRKLTFHDPVLDQFKKSKIALQEIGNPPMLCCQ